MTVQSYDRTILYSGSARFIPGSALGKLKLEREENIEDLVDEALREYIERHE